MMDDFRWIPLNIQNELGYGTRRGSLSNGCGKAQKKIHVCRCEKRTMQILLNIAVTVSLWLVYKELWNLTVWLWCLLNFCTTSVLFIAGFPKFIWCNFFSKQSLSRRNCSWIRGRILDTKSCDKFMVTYCFTCIFNGSIFGLRRLQDQCCFKNLFQFSNSHQKYTLLSLYLFILVKVNIILNAVYPK